MEFFQRDIREHSDIYSISHIDTTSDSAGNVYVIDHAHIKIQTVDHRPDCREDRTFGTDKVINVYLCNLDILHRTGILFKCDHIASHSIFIVPDSLSLTDKFSLGIDNSTHEKLTDHINDTGATKSYRLRSRLANYLIGWLHCLFVNRTGLDCTVCCTHTAADVSTLKGRAS